MIFYLPPYIDPAQQDRKINPSREETSKLGRHHCLDTLFYYTFTFLKMIGRGQVTNEISPVISHPNTGLKQDLPQP